MSGLTNDYHPSDYRLFDFRLTSNNAQLRTLADNLVDDLSLKTDRRDNVKVDLMICILANLFQASLQWKCLAISRTPEWYAKIPVDERLLIHSYDFVTAILDALVRHGLIEQYLGQHSDSTGELTKIHPNDDLKQKLNFLTNADLEYLLQEAEIILRDSNGVSIPFTETSETTAMRNDIIAYNSLLSRTEITLTGLTSDDRSSHSDYLLRSTYYNSENSRKVRLRPMRMRRIFNLDFQHGGRFYGGIENMPSDLRAKLNINGQPTVELDYAAYQLRMLYHMKQIKYKRDAYAVAAGYIPEHRGIYKVIALAALNAQNEQDCLKGIRNDLRKSDLGGTIGGVTDSKIKPLLTNWINAHAPISEYMYSGIGLRLQAYDSDIVNELLKHFTRRGILVLSVHDSFLIEAGRSKGLKRIMRSCYRQRFGFNPEIK